MFLFLQASKARSLSQHHRLVDLNFTTNVRRDTRDKIAEEERGRKPDDTIREFLELRQVLTHCSFLCKLKKRTRGVLVL